MAKTFRVCVLMIAMIVANNATAAPSSNYYADEVYAASRTAYTMLVHGTEIIQTCVGCQPLIRTNQEPAVCWPYPVHFEDFYWTIQQTVNGYVEGYPKRERGKLGVTIGFKVWDAMQDNWGC